jgi:hypothetical protein
MLAGCLRKLGYFMGDNLIAARESNPKGFFEDDEINRINEALMKDANVPFAAGHGWLTAVRSNVEVAPRRAVLWRMRAQTARAPFCFKDPRFCYTLPAWRPFIQDAVVLCVFREPARTANSIVKECRQRYWTGLEMNFERALDLWVAMYRNILDQPLAGDRFVFVHYEQLLDESAAPRLEAVLGTGIDTGFPDRALRRSLATGVVGPEAQEVYRRLCSLAGYVPEAASYSTLPLAGSAPP